MQSYILRFVVIICAAAKLIDICFVMQEEANCVGTSPPGGVQQGGHIAAVMLVSYYQQKKTATKQNRICDYTAENALWTSGLTENWQRLPLLCTQAETEKR